MKLLKLVQGSPSWHEHRSRSRNASEAAMMLGVSPYLTRSALLHWRSTGIAPEWDDATLRLFAEGHRCEALARPLAEKIVEEDLYPCVVTDGGVLSASLDGITLAGDTVFEHKMLNSELREAIQPNNSITALPEHYCVQMEQQLMVSGANRVLFMASAWNGDELVEERHCWYLSDSALRARILAGWEQFAVDLAAYQPQLAAAPAPVGRAPTTLPALHIEVSGAVTASNLVEFRNHAIAVFQGINTDLQTDQDFADAEQTVKWCGDIEDRLDAAKAHALSQTASIDTLFRAIDDIKTEARAKRLELDRLVKARKESIRGEIVAKARDAYRAHEDQCRIDTGGIWIVLPQPDFGGAIKGKRSIASMRDAVDTMLANAKIGANESARKIRAAIAALDTEAVGYEHLFADRLSFAGKPIEDIRTIARGRIAEHKQRESARLDTERERIRQEEEVKARAAVASPPIQTRITGAGSQVEAPAAASATIPAKGPVAAARSDVRINLGEINARITPLKIDADGLAQLGFKPVGTDRAAKLYAESDWPSICDALANVIQCASNLAL